MAQPFHAPRDPEDERPCELGGRFGEHVGRVRRGRAVAPDGGDVDVVVADRDVGDDLQLRARGHHLVVDAIGEDADDGVLAGHAAQQFVARNRPFAAIHVDVVLCFEGREDGRGDPSCEEDRTH